MQMGNEEVDIRVRFPDSARRSRESLDHVMVANPTGGLIRLTDVTRLEKGRGAALISRLDFKRILMVKADLDTSKATSLQVNQQLKEKFADVESRYPGYQVNYGGEDEETAKTMGELGVLFLFALAIIFILLAIFMDSLILPVVVMCAIPFSLVGVSAALFVHGQPFGFMSVLGMFSLAGVIVSNTLVLVEFINLQRKEGKPLLQALLDAGTIRLRPVILTTGTTVLGLFPTIYAGMEIYGWRVPGGRDYFVAPLALAFGYGLIFATVITLGLIPCFYHIAEDM
jgi:multidrug efflux pump subunit AcrB